jgi:hypothetical protein
LRLSWSCEFHMASKPSECEFVGKDKAVELPLDSWYKMDVSKTINNLFLTFSRFSTGALK